MNTHKCHGHKCPLKATCWHFRAHQIVASVGVAVKEYLTPTVEGGKCKDYNQIEFYGN